MHVAQNGDCTEIEKVARRIIEATNASFTEDHALGSMSEEVLAGQEPLFDGRGHSTLQKNGFARFPNCFEQREILHVARADLHEVGIFGDRRNVPFSQRFGDDEQSHGICSSAYPFERSVAVTLKRVGAGPRFPRAATHERHAVCRENCSRLLNLLFGFEAARSAHEDGFARTNRDATDLHDVTLCGHEWVCGRRSSDFENAIDSRKFQGICWLGMRRDHVVNSAARRASFDT